MDTTKTCGSELAREGGLTVNTCIDCHTAIASKLAPTEDPSQATNLWTPQKPVGASLLAKAD